MPGLSYLLCDRPDRRAQCYMPLLRSSGCLQWPNDNTAKFTNDGRKGPLMRKTQHICSVFTHERRHDAKKLYDSCSEYLDMQQKSKATEKKQCNNTWMSEGSEEV